MTVAVLVLLIVVAVETWLLLDLTVRRRHAGRKALIHHHDWSEWSGWVEEMPYSTVRRWARQRVCHECGTSTRREVGKHECTVRAGESCPHRAEFAVLFEDKVTRLERELRIEGDGWWDQP